MTQRMLFNEPEKTKKPKQDAELERVSNNIRDLIMDFHDKIGIRVDWHMEQLHKFVRAKSPVAPASCDRVLRMMRGGNELNYEVRDRSQSLYQFIEPTV